MHPCENGYNPITKEQHMVLWVLKFLVIHLKHQSFTCWIYTTQHKQWTLALYKYDSLHFTGSSMTWIQRRTNQVGNVYIFCNMIAWNLHLNSGPSWSLSFGSWIYNYLCNQCLSPLTLWVRIPLRRDWLDTTLCDKVCQWSSMVFSGYSGFLHQ